MKVIATMLVVVAVLAVIGLALGIWFAKPEVEPPVPPLAMVPDFHLVDQTGAEFSRADLAGDVWVAAFIFTSIKPMPRPSALEKRLCSWVMSHVLEYPSISCLQRSMSFPWKTLFTTAARAL